MLVCAVIEDAFQSTHPLWGGTDRNPVRRDTIIISIHPPLVGWDRSQTRACGRALNFNPPTPCGVGPSGTPSGPDPGYFNPPTPCGVGPDHQDAVLRRDNFNPPTPCGVGLLGLTTVPLVAIFQSTHPLWGGTGVLLALGVAVGISIHPPLVGWDHYSPPVHTRL